MKFGIPQNVFAALFAFSLNDKYKMAVSGSSSAILAKQTMAGEYDLALIPTCDLLTHKELFVSKKVALSFDGELSNSYLYFQGGGAIDSFFMRGDVTSNEIILSKLLFQEKLKKDIDVTIDTGDFDMESKNYIISGMENFENSLYEKGLSFSDQVADMIDYPYVNFVVASKSKDVIEEFNKTLVSLDKKIEDNVDTYLANAAFDDKLTSLIKNKLDQVYFELTDNEIEGLNEMLRLPFYKGLIKEIVEVKYI